MARETKEEKLKAEIIGLAESLDIKQPEP